MLQTWFANPLGLPVRLALAVLPLLVTVGLLAASRRRRALARLGHRAALLALSRPRLGWRLLRGGCLAGGLLLLVVGLAGPQWGRDWEKSAAPGRDLVVVLDLSRSMLAEDVQPSRAAKARAALNDLSQAIEEQGGHRLALVAFTDRALVVCPLTHDYDFFRAKLNDLDYDAFTTRLTKLDEAAPGGRPAPAASGTRIGAGLRKAVEVHDPRYRGFQEILLISDGDDPADDREWRTGIDVARQHGIPVHTVGVGDPQAGSRIPLRGGFLKLPDGEEVRTRLHEEPLEEIARRTGGSYTPARTNDLQLGKLFSERIAVQGVREETDEALTLPVYRQRYPWFLGAAFVLLAGQMALGPYRPSRLRPSAVPQAAIRNGS
jgi:Ca-activated chloride channel family protein